MEDEIDLRDYIRLLLGRWWLIGGLAIVAALAALGISFLLPPQYESEALVAFTVPQYMPNFDPRFETVNSVVFPYRAFPELASSDGVLMAVKERIEQDWPAYRESVQTLAKLRGLVQARSGADTSLVTLRVRSGDPQETAVIANVWAEVFVAHARDIYGRSSQELAYYEDQLGNAAAELGRAEQALVEFQGRNEGGTLTGQREALLKAQRGYLDERKAVEDMVRDLGEILAQLDRSSFNDRVTLGDELTALALQIKAFNAGDFVPIQLQLDDAAALANRSVGELRAFLQGLSSALEERQTAIASSLAGIEPQVLALQEQIQVYENELTRLTLDRDVAKETYLTVSNKVEEARLAAEAPSDVARLASRAAVPSKPVYPRRLQSAVIGGMLGLALGVSGVLFGEWWRRGRSHAWEAK